MDSARIYHELVARAKARAACRGYTEKHHIVPRAHGGGDDEANLVVFTAREHFLAHWLLFRIHGDHATARAFRLMVHDRHLPRGRDYAWAKEVQSDSMRGERNVAKRSEVRAKISIGVLANHGWRGKKRPEHAAHLRETRHWTGANNPHYGNGHKQAGALNHYARSVRGVHPVFGVKEWPTMQEVSNELGVSHAAISQAIKKRHKSKKWVLEVVS